MYVLMTKIYTSLMNATQDEKKHTSLWFYHRVHRIVLCSNISFLASHLHSP